MVLERLPAEGVPPAQVHIGRCGVTWQQRHPVCPQCLQAGDNYDLTCEHAGSYKTCGHGSLASACSMCSEEGVHADVYPEQGPDPEAAPATSRAVAPPLEFVSLADLCARVDAAGPRRWLLRGIWPAGDYGVHSAATKAQKTWNTVDVAVSVASGTPWLGTIAVDDPGPVLMLAGEGGEADLVRRIRAVCASRDLKAEDLPVTVLTRVPHLSNTGHLLQLAAVIDAQRPRLVTLDPLYLAARGAKTSLLNEMGAMLEAPQHLCQAAGAALWVATHNNRRESKGADQISGAGPGEWGRVLLLGNVKSRHLTDSATKETTVVVKVHVIGGGIPDQALLITRRIWSDRPDDLDAPLHYAVTVEEETDEDAPAGLSPAATKILAVLGAADLPLSNKDIGDAVKSKFGHGLTRPTISKTCAALVADGLVDEMETTGPGGAKFWTVAAHG